MSRPFSENVATAVFAAVLIHALAAQSPETPAPQSPPVGPTSVAFEVASIKTNPPREALPIVAVWPGGRFMAPSATARTLIRVAYNVEDYQVAGGPSWAETEPFEVIATTGTTTSALEIRAMLRALLAERFKLIVHAETRELPIYVLALARTDGRVGERLRASGPECAPPTPPVLPTGVPVPPPPPPPPAGGGAMPLSTTVVLRCPSMFATGIGIGHISAREMTMPQLALRLTPVVGRPVIDRSGLAGVFDLDLTFAADGPTAGVTVAGAPDAPSIFTALQEQLGLRLNATRGPVDVLVIDSIEPPGEN